MILIFGCGRTGTNLTLEILAHSSVLNASNPPEDKLLFKRYIEYPESYITKCDTIYCSSYEEFKIFMKNNPKAKVIWTIRDPRDVVLSKFYRGSFNNADDATPAGCLDDMYYMFYLYKRATRDYKDRILTVRMEDTIVNLRMVVYNLLNFTNLPFEMQMMEPYKYMRHPGKKARYTALDKSQLVMWSRFKEIYNGYFKDKEEIIEYMFKMVKPLTNYFGYNYASTKW